MGRIRQAELTSVLALGVLTAGGLLSACSSDEPNDEPPPTAQGSASDAPIGLLGNTWILKGGPDDAPPELIINIRNDDAAEVSLRDCGVVGELERDDSGDRFNFERSGDCAKAPGFEFLGEVSSMGRARGQALVLTTGDGAVVARYLSSGLD